jgi:competence protein ComEA
MRLSPPERRRRDATRPALLVLLLVGAAPRLLGGLARPEPASGPPPRPAAIDLARDPAWRLVHLPGIGPGRAEAIVRARLLRGPLRRVEDLLEIRGIGPGTVRLVRAAREVRVVVDGHPPQAAPP